MSEQKWPEEEMINLAAEPEVEQPPEEEIVPEVKKPAKKKAKAKKVVKEVKPRALKRKPSVDFVCPACGASFKAAISVKWKVYTCPECKEKYNLRPSAPQAHGGKE